MDRPPHNESFGCPCENGPRHGRTPLNAHGERSWKDGEVAARRPTRGPVRWIIIATGLALAPGLPGCSPSASDSEAKASRDRELPNFIGEHFYACPDGSRLDVDFLGDGLTLDIKTDPNAAPVRVTSPASGLTYVGPNLNVSISGGDRITLKRPGGPALACNRVLAYRDSADGVPSGQAKGPAV
jgi:hypothetical protein